VVKLVSVVERERPKECAIVCVVELGGASIRDEDGGNMSDAIIPALDPIRTPKLSVLGRE